MEFNRQFELIKNAFNTSSERVKGERWQGVDVSRKPEMEMHELRHRVLRVPLLSEDLDHYRSDIKPNLPWADDHFQERVCGMPINPGIQWAKWPWGQNAKNFLDFKGKFNHNYMERYWPRKAGQVDYGTETPDEYLKAIMEQGGGQVVRGIYHPYGDLFNVVDQLEREPHTRQAILPIFFPEDTGAVHQDRIPCSIYYHFIMRNNRMDIVYAIRSCDFVRHFRDDIYLTIRLLLWMLLQLRERSERWNDVRPGEFVMMITSLHMFRNDYLRMFGRAGA